MKTFASLAMLLGLGLFAVGCSESQQLENAQDDLQAEQAETAETVGDALDDGIVTSEEQGDIVEQQGEAAEQAGEVVEQQGDVIEEDTDN